MRLATTVIPVVLAAAIARPAAAEHPSLAQARALYNAAKYAEAISAATVARSDPASADAAALVVGRSHLERHRALADVVDLTAARIALGAVRPAALSPRDRLDLLVGLGQALYLGDSFGAAAALFDAALSQPVLLPDRDRLLLLDWWATAVDRDAHARPPDRRMALYAQVTDRMEIEVRVDPGSAPANYWLAASARGAGDLERAWDAAVAGWIRAQLRPESAGSLRADLDRLVIQALIGERARIRPAREQAETLTTLRAEWEGIKNQWP
jgi:phage terminase Nu1 subunit (DNA packaging protein)